MRLFETIDLVFGVKGTHLLRRKEIPQKQMLASDIPAPRTARGRISVAYPWPKERHVAAEG
jgi:hypothetical protein